MVYYVLYKSSTEVSESHLHLNLESDNANKISLKGKGLLCGACQVTGHELAKPPFSF